MAAESEAPESDSQAGERTIQATEQRAWLATFGLSAVLFAAAVASAFDLATLLWVPDWLERASAGETTAEVFATAYFVIYVAAFVAFVFTVVTFLMWLHGVSRNAWSPYPEGVRSSPRMAVGAWFIPFVNLVRPYRVVRALHSAAFIDGPALRGDWVARAPSVFPIWWGTWLVYNGLTNVGARLGFSKDPEMVRFGLWLETLALPLQLASGFCLMAIIWSIQARQAELARLAQQPAPAAFRPLADSAE